MAPYDVVEPVGLSEGAGPAMSSKCKFFHMLVISYYHTKFPQIIKATNSDRMLLQDRRFLKPALSSLCLLNLLEKDSKIKKKKSIYIFLRLAGQNARRRGNGV